ncbi:MAG: hypothetical protein F4Y44_04780 [Chloroflexi bacterium]|nr:hypothetical protein [Chloroflexota bacterium]
MCLIYTNSTTVACFGSNAHGVVSGVPNVSGFTSIDGGETYACAFNEISQFSYCWGSITRRPTTARPTVTPTRLPATPIPTPTSTTGAAPTATPVATATPEPNACELDIPDTFTLPLTLTGSWIADEDCVDDVIRPDAAPVGNRYFRHVLFGVTSATGDWTVTLTSEEDTFMVLSEIDGVTGELTIVGVNDDIDRNNTNSRITWTPTQGNSYFAYLTTYDPNTTGDFTLTIEASGAGAQGQRSVQSINLSDIQSELPQK